MFTVEKVMEVSAAHRLCLPYESRCNALHGHNWKIKVVCQSEELDENQMVMDFGTIRKVVMELDHCNLNSVMAHPTAEWIANWIALQLGPKCVRVEVQETEGNTACYTR